MNEMTLADARAKHAELGVIIAALMARPVTTISLDAVEIALNEGEHYAGAVLNDDGTVKHHLVLMAAKPEERLNWKDALAWADRVNGFLPTRQEAALIFANCRPHVEEVWHWTSEVYEPDASYAWYCFFYYGYQGYNRKVFPGAARAVRRLNP